FPPVAAPKHELHRLPALFPAKAGGNPDGRKATTHNGEGPPYPLPQQSRSIPPYRYRQSLRNLWNHPLSIAMDGELSDAPLANVRAIVPCRCQFVHLSEMKRSIVINPFCNLL